MFTSIEGKAELSTRPVIFLPTTGLSPTTPSVTWFTTVQVTFGTSFGTRPKTSRSKSSTISGRRSFHHASGVATFPPFFNVRGSGRSG
jgi:hypothetical protein